MTRQEMIQHILSVKNKEFQNEISYFTHDIGDRESSYDEVMALLEMDDRTGWKGEDKCYSYNMIKTIRQCLIDIGFYRIMSQAEIDETFTSSGRVQYNFKIDNVAYTTDYNYEEWYLD